MQSDANFAQEEAASGAGKLLLGVDTCGPAGTVALARLLGSTVEILAQTELEGRHYSSTLVAAIADLLAGASVRLGQLHAVVVVNGPGSFTGVRIGLSAAKGLAEPCQIPVVAVSRLQVLAARAGCPAAALDAHRHEVFLRIGGRELLAGAEELAEGDLQARGSRPQGFSVAVCDDAAAALLATAWPAALLVRTEPPTAADALILCASRVEAGDFADLALLDAHYLRRSDAEIFGNAPRPKAAASERT